MSVALPPFHPGDAFAITWKVKALRKKAGQTPFWFREPFSGGLEVAYLCDQMVYAGRTRYQRIDIVDTRVHGRMLFLDGIGQSSERDEFIYHEMLVHPALFSHPHPRSALVIGGATGASLREILRHPSIEHVVMADIDGELTDICKHYLPNWHRGSFQDPRLQLVIEDGRRFVESCHESFDCMIIDLSDPIEGGPAMYLFTIEFYEALKRRLNPGGAITFQGEGISPQDLELHARMTNTLRRVFPTVHPYPYTLYSFHRPDAHILATGDPDWSLKAFLERVQETPMPTRYFCPDIAKGMFSLPRYLLEAYETCTDILTDNHLAFEEKPIEERIVHAHL